jgi:hypothetical protein
MNFCGRGEFCPIRHGTIRQKSTTITPSQLTVQCRVNQGTTKTKPAMNFAIYFSNVLLKITETLVK